MQKATALAHPNLAFLKYWGKRDSKLNIPLNNSISMNLGGVYTQTTVEFDNALAEDEVLVVGQGAEAKFDRRVSKHLDRIRSLAQVSTRARVKTQNSFPAGTGFASSASGFAALTLAAAAALNLNLDERQLSILARQGSGSACRSIPDGFVEWIAGETSEDSFARQLATPDHWDIVDVAVAVSQEQKKVSSSEGHELALNSPFWDVRAGLLPSKYERMRHAILERNLVTFGQELETEAMMMHSIMMTSAHHDNTSWYSGIYYWLPDTLELIMAVQTWRADGLEVYFTLDAGPTVHLICLESNKSMVAEAVRRLATQHDRLNWVITENHPAPGARLVDG
ncbi:MAG: diphosphomevalonate decarboxylase [Anaerolineae bacterium]|nr:diphosphomevalonate decarboxylase [Anaerolineae bacterium]